MTLFYQNDLNGIEEKLNKKLMDEGETIFLDDFLKLLQFD